MCNELDVPDFLKNKLVKKEIILKKGSAVSTVGRPWFANLLPLETYKKDTLAGLITMQKEVTIRLEFEYEMTDN